MHRTDRRGRFVDIDRGAWNIDAPLRFYRARRRSKILITQT
jgi:hypothetical protein